MKDPVVLLISDEPQRQADLCARILQDAEYEVQVCQSTGRLKDLYQSLRPSCICAYMKMPDYLGIDIHRTLINMGIAAPVIILSEAADVPMAVTAIKQGAYDVLPWPIARAELLDAINQALHSDKQRIEHQLAHEDLKSRIEELTPREKEILQLVVDGMSSSQIAFKLVRSEKTVKLHRAHIMKKLDCDSAHELVHRMIKLQFDLDRIAQSI